MQNFSIEKPAKDVMVLDLLHLLKENDSSISFRRSCREGVQLRWYEYKWENGLACITPLSDALKEQLELRPLPGLPVIRDLIVDMTQFYDQYEKIKPFCSQI